MIIWGSGSGSADLGISEHKHCETCEKVRAFKTTVQYRYSHLYYFRWVTKKTYRLACEICSRGWELNKKDVERTLEKSPIPFLTRYGWTFLAGFIALVFIVGTFGDKIQ